ncbi:alpha/beta fold hydrolase [Corynebacterium mendelii]|uniref:Alpha/beta hydrolase n=1 Tax=Corynebacterium mendelii TaxID=2765362 RepID=A0A939E0M5_9CORY|nr:alpha/beta hydrolase [Corynebacterium mendelii]MBN9644265.1 alpha/beta hydrolase [Corynebacterium mendelii]
MGIAVPRLVGALRRLALRVSEPGRQHLDKVRDRIHDDSRRPGLADIDEETTIDGPVCRLHVYWAGPKDPAVTVVFIHGFTLAAEAFFSQVDYIREQFPDAACLLLDVRGHGATGEVREEYLTVDGTADDVEAAVTAFAPTGPLILVGHSLGGMTALNLMRRKDRRLTSRVAGLVLINTASAPMASSGTPMILDTKVGKRFIDAVTDDKEETDAMRANLKELLAPALAATVFHNDGVDFDIVEFHASMINNTPTSTFTGFYPDLRDHAETAAGQAIRDLPGCILVGAKDQVTPPDQAQALSRMWPAADVVEVDGCGHMLILEAPGKVNDAIGGLVEKVTDLTRKHPDRSRARADCREAQDARDDYGDPLTSGNRDDPGYRHCPDGCGDCGGN